MLCLCRLPSQQQNIIPGHHDIAGKKAVCSVVALTYNKSINQSILTKIVLWLWLKYGNDMWMWIGGLLPSSFLARYVSLCPDPYG